MKRFFIVFLLAFLVNFSPISVFSQQNQDLLPQVDVVQPDEPEEEYYEEEVVEEEQPPPLQRQTIERPAIEDVEEGEYGKDIVIDMVLSLDYVMNEGGGFEVKYNIHLEGTANSKVSIIKGDAEIKTSVDGPLAKWDSGECKLNVTIPKVPFEITFRRNNEEEGRVNLRFKNAIMENWSSECTFLDAPEAKFVTSGPPEKWLSKAIQKASPPINALPAKLDPRSETTSTSTINSFPIEDQPIGNAEIQGTIVITVKPK